MKIFIDNREVLHTGSLVCPKDKEVQFELSNDYKVILVFVDNDSKEQSIKSNICKERHILIYTIENFSNPLGTELLEPIEVGVFENHPLFLQLKVYGSSQSINKNIIYTWLKGEKNEK